MVENRMSETEAGEIIREMHKKAEDLIIDILKVHANRIYEFIREVEERAGGTPESALEYLGELLPEYADKIKSRAEVTKVRG